LAAFESELARQRYDRHIDALNLYRTYSLPPDVESAEALTLVAPTAAPAWLAGYNESAPPGIVRLTEGALARATTWGETLREANRDLEHAVQSLSVALDHERAERIALRDAIASLRDARDSERAFLHGQLDAVRAECEQNRQRWPRTASTRCAMPSTASTSPPRGSCCARSPKSCGCRSTSRADAACGSPAAEHGRPAAVPPLPVRGGQGLPPPASLALRRPALRHARRPARRPRVADHLRAARCLA